MQGAGIVDGDILVVDRAENPVNGSMVIAAIDGDCLVKIYSLENRQVWLRSAHPGYPNIEITEDNNFQIWGVVTGVVRQHGSNGRVRTD